MKRKYPYRTSETKAMTFKAAILLVVGVHLFGVIGFFLYEKMPKEKKITKIEQNKGPYSDALQSAWPQAKPIIVATPQKIKNKKNVGQEKQVTPCAPIIPKPTEYILSAGDNFYTVSRKLNVSFSKLAEYNGIKDVRTLKIGQIIKIPKES
jgi:hypothetical protein